MVSLRVQYSQSAVISRVVSACPSREGFYQPRRNDKYSRIFIQLSQLLLGILNSSCLCLSLLLDHCREQCGQPHKHEMYRRMVVIETRGSLMLKAVVSLQKHAHPKKDFDTCSFLPLNAVWATVRALRNLQYSTSVMLNLWDQTLFIWLSCFTISALSRVDPIWAVFSGNLILILVNVIAASQTSIPW